MRRRVSFKHGIFRRQNLRFLRQLWHKSYLPTYCWTNKLLITKGREDGFSKCNCRCSIAARLMTGSLLLSFICSSDIRLRFIGQTTGRGWMMSCVWKHSTKWLLVSWEHGGGSRKGDVLSKSCEQGNGDWVGSIRLTEKLSESELSSSRLRCSLSTSWWEKKTAILAL